MILERIARRKRSFKTSPVSSRELLELNTTQGKVEGFDLSKYQAGHVVMIGCGGIGSHVASSLVRKGIGKLTLCDDDVVELKNNTRQLFGRDDVGKWKAVALGRRLSSEGMFPTEIASYPKRFEELVEEGIEPPEDAVLIAGVDNNPSRYRISEYAYKRGMRVIHSAVAADGGSLYVMVQEAGHACWSCALPQYVNDRSYPCNLPGIIDVLQVVAGHIVYAVDSLLCDRHREWNVRTSILSGGMRDNAYQATKRMCCPICGVKVLVAAA